MRQPFAILGLCLALAACAGLRPGTPERPDWVDGKPAAYPASRYLVGVGAADAPGVAQDRARADVAKTFEVSIRAVDSSLQQVDQRIVAGRTEEAVERLALQSVAARTELALKGVAIAERWRDPHTQEYHALAVLERGRAAAGLEQEVSDLDRATAGRLERAQGAADPLERVGQLRRAIDLQVQRAGLQGMLRVLDPSGAGVPGPWGLAELRSQLAAELRSVRIAVSAPDGELAARLAAAVAGAGFRHVDSGQDPHYLLAGRLDTQDLGVRDGWYWLRGTLEVELRGPTGGNVLGRRSWPLKAAALNRVSAEARLMTEADGRLEDDLQSVLLQFAGGG